MPRHRRTSSWAVALRLVVAALATISVLQISQAATVDIVLATPQAEARNFPSKIFVAGNIDAKTVDQVKALISTHGLKERGAWVYLDSPGGSLLQAMSLGSVIRGSGLSTFIGSKPVRGTYPDPGLCASACVYAFIGGHFRYARKDDRIGVHRFYAESVTPEDVADVQQMSAAITSYLKEMGVDTELFEVASATPSGNIKWLPLARAMSLGVVNNGELPASWDLVSLEKIIYLRGEQTSRWGTGKLLFNCLNGRVLIGAFYDTGSVAQAELVADTKRYSFRIDDVFNNVTLSTAVMPPIGSFVNAYFWLAPESVTSMLHAKKLGFVFHPEDPKLFFGFQIDAEEGRSEISNYLAFCQTQVRR